MLGFLIGTACLIGLIKTLRRGPRYALSLIHISEPTRPY